MIDLDQAIGDGDHGSNMSRGIQAGLEGIKQRGKAELKDKTMVDAWAPVAEALTNGTFSNDTIDQAVEDTKPL